MPAGTVIPDLATLSLHDARVVDVVDETAWCVRLRVDATGCDALQRLRTPGQYVGLGVPGGEARWFVVASRAADLPVAEFLIGRGSEVSDALAGLSEGSTVQVSAPQGDGFAMDQLRDRPVAFFASGTGLAAVRPVIDDLLAAPGPPPRLSLYYQERVRGDVAGERSPCEFALVDERAAWAERGVDIYLACDARPHGAPQFVDTLWRNDDRRAPAGETAFVVCGNEALEEMVAALLASEGLSADRILRNY